MTRVLVRIGSIFLALVLHDAAWGRVLMFSSQNLTLIAGMVLVGTAFSVTEDTSK